MASDRGDFHLLDDPEQILPLLRLIAQGPDALRAQADRLCGPHDTLASALERFAAAGLARLDANDIELTPLGACILSTEMQTLAPLNLPSPTFRLWVEVEGRSREIGSLKEVSVWLHGALDRAPLTPHILDTSKRLLLVLAELVSSDREGARASWDGSDASALELALRTLQRSSLFWLTDGLSLAGVMDLPFPATAPPEIDTLVGFLAEASEHQVTFFVTWS